MCKGEMAGSERNLSLPLKERTEQDGAVFSDKSEQPTEESVRETVYKLVMNDHDEHQPAVETRLVSSCHTYPSQLLNSREISDVENSATGSVASCSDSGICSTPYEEEDPCGFEEIPLNVSADMCDGVNAINFGNSLSEKLRQVEEFDDVTLGRQKTRGKFRNLFGRSSLKVSDNSNLLVSLQNQGLTGSALIQRSSRKKQKVVAPVLSTTGLIFENRPRNLPAKDPKEEKRHRQLYQQMIEVAKKKELQDHQEQKKKQENQSQHEHLVSSALALWNKEVLPNWDNMKCTKKVLELWWLGLPPSIRGQIWKLAIGNDLHITQELFEIFRCHAEQKLLNNENSKSRLKSGDLASRSQNFVTDSMVDLITMDVSRTFPCLGIFQKGGPYHNVLYKILGAYSCYRPDIGYVQGMAFLAAVLLLNMEEINAFICFANLINRPMQMAFFSVDQPMMRAYFLAFEVHLQDHLPKLEYHFNDQGLTPDLYLTDWIFTLYSKSLPLDVASRVWDLFCRDGEEFLFRTALGILHMFSCELMTMEFITLAQFLTKLPENISETKLFESIANMTITREKFNQVLVQQTQKVLQLYPADKLKQHPTLRA